MLAEFAAALGEVNSLIRRTSKSQRVGASFQLPAPWTESHNRGYYLSVAQAWVSKKRPAPNQYRQDRPASYLELAIQQYASTEP